MLTFERELGYDGVQMLSDLCTSLAIGYDRVHFYHRFHICNIYRVRIPSVDILCDEFMIHIFDAPVVYEILPELTFDIAITCHDHHRFVWGEDAVVLSLLILHQVSSTANKTSLNWRLSSWVVKADVSVRLPFLFILIVGEYISR